MKIRNYVIAVASFMGMLSISLASNANGNTKTGDTTPVEVKYVGQLNDQPLFQLNIKNNGTEEYSITITDKEGTRLYQDNTKGKDYSKRFLINLDETQGSPLTLEVKAKSTDKSEVYEIKANNKMVRETEASITKL